MSAITIMDGGMGQELIRRQGAATSLWSIKALLDAPELVRQIHTDFFAAGAEVATTNTYSVLPDRLQRHEMIDQLGALTRLACRLALEARDAFGKGRVLGSLGPLGFSYQPDLAPLPDEAAEIYARCARLQGEDVDGHILETMSSPSQARGGLMGAGVTGKPVWLAISVDDCDGQRFRSGDPVTDILPLVAEFRPAALLINCARPEAVSTAVRALAPDCPVPLGAYANGFAGISSQFNRIGATVDLLTARKDLGPEAYLRFAQTWVQEGASLIGGCCEVGPKHIAALTRHFRGHPAQSPALMEQNS